MKAAQRRRRRVGDDRAPARHRAGRGKRHGQARGSRSAASATRSSTRWSSRSARRTSSTAPRPANDAKNFGKYALNPELARLLNALFKLGVKETNRTDIVQALLTGVPGLTQIGRQAGRRRHAEAQPRRRAERDARTASACSRATSPGFPNGRRLADDVTDIELRVIAGALLKPSEGGKQIPLGDGVDQNDKPFRSSFPYVALPDGRVHRPAPSGRAGARARPAAAGLSPRGVSAGPHGSRPRTRAAPVTP